MSGPLGVILLAVGAWAGITQDKIENRGLLDHGTTSHIILGGMKHSLIIFFLITGASIGHATSNITFSGGGYEISVLLSDEDCKVVGLTVSGDNPNIISISTNELTAFSKAESDCKKKTIHLVVPETKSHPNFELKSTSKRGYMTLGEKKVNVSADWQM